MATMALRPDTKLFCCFLAPRAESSPFTGRPYETPNRRLLVRLVALFQRWRDAGSRRREDESAAHGRDPFRALEAKTLQVSVETLRLWRLGATELSTARLRLFVRKLEDRAKAWAAAIGGSGSGELEDPTLLLDLGRFRAMLESGVEVYSARELLGFENETEMQIAIDTYVYRRRPLLESAWLPHAEDTVEAIDSQQKVRPLLGHWLVYLRRNGGWWRCPARVRYLLTLDYGQAFVRFKMAVPDSSGRLTEGHSLDGVVIPKDPHLSWIAAPRSAHQQDVMCLLTGSTFRPIDVVTGRWSALEGADSLATTGKYMTIDQTTGAPVADELLLVQYRACAPGELASHVDRAFMCSVRMLKPDEDESRLVERLFEQLNSRDISLSKLAVSLEDAKPSPNPKRLRSSGPATG